MPLPASSGLNVAGVKFRCDGSQRDHPGGLNVGDDWGKVLRVVMGALSCALSPVVVRSAGAVGFDTLVMVCVPGHFEVMRRGTAGQH